MKPIIAVGALGGTIAMSAEGTGAVRPELSADDLVGAVPALADVAQIRAETISNVASPAILPRNVLDALDFATRSIDEGATGVVLTHGTDTLEETAYLLDLLWDREEPLVVTGAMRSPNLPGADGPANLLAAVVTAGSEDARGMGVLVVLDDTVHLARLAAKTHATAVWTFQSPGWGPVGRVAERRLRMALRPMRMFDPLPAPGDGPIRIPIVETPFGDEGDWVRAIASLEPPALVVQASGVGHMSEPVSDACEELVRSGIPVIMASRTGSGTTLEKSYGYPGSEQDLIARGLIPTGFLTARKTRLLVHVLLEFGADEATIRREIAARGF
ncbi:asparaginase [Flaviflexus salsibiostraticola]|uniref:Asparaginase n=1 Tax=Flaviflexus salsibiostraticola TaxID=1282737 RepID=A0A3Q8WVI9_9ACTO|nr:asparaginase [Flaviflexus salsibiostraticola]AZN30109.1 asparaginase [Flaviflexus salsibiostraticola]